MLLGAIVDAGLSLDALAGELATLPVTGYRLTAEKVVRAGVTATKVDVVLDDEVLPLRRLADVLAIIDGSGLPDADKDVAGQVFRLADAEGARPRRRTGRRALPQKSARSMRSSISRAQSPGCGCSAWRAVLLRAGGGQRLRARRADGSVPGPATALLLADARAPLRDGAGSRRWSWSRRRARPIVAELARILPSGDDAARGGNRRRQPRHPRPPNVLRLFLGEAAERSSVRTMLLVETNIDDMPAELFGKSRGGCSRQARRTPGSRRSDEEEPAGRDALRPLPPGVGGRGGGTAARGDEHARPARAGMRRHEAAREVLRFESSLGPAAVKVKRLPGPPTSRRTRV
jgi:hypothetical protein